jgi:hypothetical protein
MVASEAAIQNRISIRWGDWWVHQGERRSRERRAGSTAVYCQGWVG